MRPVFLASYAATVAVACASIACSATSGGSMFTTSSTNGSLGTGASAAHATGAGTGATGQGGNTGLGGSFAVGAGAGTGAGGGTPGCSAAAELVYVFGTDNWIYSFDPPNKTFTKIAQPDCLASGTPNSMAIDRNLVAWLNYIGGIYTFDLKTKSGCKQAIGLPNQYSQCGMGFSSDYPGSTNETLFIDGIGGAGLARVVNNAITAIGAYPNDSKLTGQSCELTGTGDAKLFGYFTTSPYVRVAQIDKGTSKILSDYELTGVAPPNDWAFSFWGGDFYLYAAPGSNTTGNSSVIHYSPGPPPKVDATYVADVGFQIIGAGVSTCAPLTPPQ